MKNRIIHKLTVTGIFLLTVLPGFSQLTNTLFFMKGVPQVYQINPAFQPPCKFFMGMPGLSPMQLRVQNEPLTLKDVLFYDNTIDSLITFMHPRADKQAFLDVLNKRNFINADVGIPLFSIGFGNISKGRFVGFDITQKFTTNFTYPRDLMRFMLVGPAENMKFDFEGFGINTMAYTEVALNVSQKITDIVTIGVRGKFLLGLADLSTTKFDVTLATSEKEWVAHSNIIMNAALPLVNLNKDASGMFTLDSISIDSDVKDILAVGLHPQNLGFAMDFGVDIRPMDWLQVSASVIDFGSIKWKGNIYNLENSSDYTYTGINVTLDGIDPFQPILDSLTSSFKFHSDSIPSPYRTWLPTKIYLGASFYVHPKISFGVLSRSEFYQKTLRQQFTLSANLYPIRMISTTFSYSIMEGSYKNLGFGLSLKPGPLNIYIITDTGPSIVFWPTEAKNLNLRIGINFMFGGKQKSAPKFDRPLVD